MNNIQSVNILEKILKYETDPKMRSKIIRNYNKIHNKQEFRYGSIEKYSFNSELYCNEKCIKSKHSPKLEIVNEETKDDLAELVRQEEYENLVHKDMLLAQDNKILHSLHSRFSDIFPISTLLNIIGTILQNEYNIIKNN